MERDKAVHKICRDIEHINEMFEQLLALTTEQKAMTDSIEAHMQETVRSTEQGVRHLAQAEKHQHASACVIF